MFDGHGGLYASIYASAHFHDNLIKHPDFDDNPANAIKASFRQTDEEFCNKAVREVSVKNVSQNIFSEIHDRLNRTDLCIMTLFLRPLFSFYQTL